ncbi:FAD-dependent oxidoreductase [Desulforamulus putei]|uniref:FAD dependent oxidoreductase n=1 Tax=Desulforamulus putei DSM 12395 TaxID=1121429 RepID=A0A1M4VDR2_9FIRM|nr:FAD-dependent oxidoreductase [Desulforamulus putei]SHE67144.1 FAD dependent oxidoreductase [Desulforamulus putei DSM 12395]
MRKVLWVLSFILLPVLGYGVFVYNQTLRQDIVIIGGGFDGCAAARSAAAAAPEKKILLVVNDPVQELGGIGTAGGQNFTDIRYWRGKVVTQGSFGRWYAKAGQFYNTGGLAQIIKEDLAQFPNIKILYGYDIEDLVVQNNTIKEVRLRSIARQPSGEVAWGESTQRIKGKIFIDATVDGRLTRLSGNPLSVGRRDWPRQYLPGDETSFSRQQAATLMFQVTGVKTPPKNAQIKDWEFVRDARGSWGLAGGKQVFAANPQVIAFNEKYGPRGFAIKPINAASNGKDSNTWWVNCLLVFNVDARAHERDKGSKRYPADTPPGHLNVDQAWVKARQFLQNPEFIRTLREFKVQDPVTGRWYGFGEAELVRDSRGLPVVGQILYIRESVHSPLSQQTDYGTENTNFAVTTEEARGAGADSQGADAENHPARIGLGYYMMDINAFIPSDLKAAGSYRWPVTGHLRPDWLEAGGEPVNPVYLPYEALLPAKAENLLVPGYAAGISSFAWAELRVLPNLAVLGDAAGVAAARSLAENKSPRNFSREDITWVQKKLQQFGARLNK